MGKKEGGDVRGLRDVDMYLKQIEGINKQYTNLVAKLTVIKDDKKKALEKTDLLMERDALKQTFIAKKKACRGNVALLPEALSVLKERELKGLQEVYRDIDADFKQLGILVERNELLAGAGERPGDFDPSRTTNDELLDKAKNIQTDNTLKLREGLATLEATKDQARHTAAMLEMDREKMQRISKGLDEVDSELEISKKLLTRFIKRIYTDKVIIAFTALILLGIVGIIIYATLNPDQTVFSVPDAAIFPNPKTVASQIVNAIPSSVTDSFNNVVNQIASNIPQLPGTRVLRGAAAAGGGGVGASVEMPLLEAAADLVL